MKSTSPIAIVGGSIVGPALALAVHKAGFRNVTVYEKSARVKTGGVLGLDHASLSFLDWLGIRQREYVPYASERVVSVTFADHRETDRTAIVYPGRSFAWHDLHNALARRITPTIRRIDSLSELDAELVVFADGRQSTGRQLVDDRPLTYAGYTAFRGWREDCPPWLVDFHRWHTPNDPPIFNAFPTRRNGTVGLDWGFYLPGSPDGFAPSIDADTRGYVLRQAERLLPATASAVIAATGRISADPITVTGAPSRAVYGRVALVGDALAPLVPHTARGANNGLAQVADLVATLSQVRRYGADLDAALDGWQSRILPRVRDDVARGARIAAALSW